MSFLTPAMKLTILDLAFFEYANSAPNPISILWQFFSATKADPDESDHGKALLFTCDLPFDKLTVRWFKNVAFNCTRSFLELDLKSSSGFLGCDKHSCVIWRKINFTSEKPRFNSSFVPESYVESIALNSAFDNFEWICKLFCLICSFRLS